MTARHSRMAGAKLLPALTFYDVSLSQASVAAIAALMALAPASGPSG